VGQEFLAPIKLMNRIFKKSIIKTKKFNRVLKRFFCNHYYEEIFRGVVGATLSWSGNPVTHTLEKKRCRVCGKVVKRKFIFSDDAEAVLHKEYYPKGFPNWPKDPMTGKKLKIYE
jgi:hypothetical protein